MLKFFKYFNLVDLLVFGLVKKPLANAAISFARDDLIRLVSNIDTNAINKFERKIRGKGAIRTGKRFTLLISNEDMNDIIKITKPLEHWSVLIDGVTETVNHKFKKHEGGFLGDLLAPSPTSVAEPVIFPVVKCITGKGVVRAGRGYHMDKNY